jgi:hypothetical protein
MPNLTERELLEDIAAVQEDLDDSDDLPSFERRRRASLRPFPQSELPRAVRSARPVGRLLRREAGR